MHIQIDPDPRLTSAPVMLARQRADGALHALGFEPPNWEVSEGGDAWEVSAVHASGAVVPVAVTAGEIVVVDRCQFLRMGDALRVIQSETQVRAALARWLARQAGPQDIDGVEQAASATVAPCL